MEAKIPPHNVEAEQAVLGALLVSEGAYEAVADILQEEDFYRDAHRMIFRAITDVVRKEKRADTVMVAEMLTREQRLEKVGGINYLGQLSLNSMGAYNVEEHAKLVADKARLRRLIDSAHKIEGMAYEGADEATEIINQAEQLVLAVGGDIKGDSSFSPMEEVVITSMERLSQLQQTTKTITGLPTGFKDLDLKTSGLQKSDLIIVAARPSMGKTAFTLNIAKNVAMKSRKTVAFFSLEMSKEQLVNRVLSAEAKVDSQKIRNGNLDGDDWTAVINAADRMSNAPLYIDDTPGMTPQLMLKKLRRLKLEHGLALVVIDYIQLMEMGGPKSSQVNRQQEVSAISRQLKLIARELDVPVIALSQLSRGVESRTDKTPLLSDLRESGSLEQDADIVAFLHRDNYQDTEDTSEGVVVDVVIRKHRNGELGKVQLYFTGQYTRFDNYAYINPSGGEGL